MLLERFRSQETFFLNFGQNAPEIATYILIIADISRLQIYLFSYKTLTYSLIYQLEDPPNPKSYFFKASETALDIATYSLFMMAY